jgi:hypothetical protein
MTPCRLGLLLMLAAAAGCGGGRATVSGRVTFGGAAVPGALVTFRPENLQHNPVTARTDAEGRFELTPPVGPASVSIDNRDQQPRPPTAGRPAVLPPGMTPTPATAVAAPRSAPPKPAGVYVPIPDRYYRTDTSGLTCKVQRGKQTFDIELR